MNEILQGDCLKVMKTLPDNSVDAVVTDPPYGLSFMGKKWDYDVPSVDIWKEALRVLKPGGYLLSFAGTRTQHRMAVNIEDAGFEIRDMIAWVYGSGFPKSLNIGKAVDKIGGKYVDWKKFQSWLKDYKTKSGYTNKQLDELLGFSTKGGGMFDHFINPSQAQIPRADTYKKIKEILKLDGSFDELIETTEREFIGKDNRGELKDNMFFNQNTEKAQENGKAIGYGEWNITKGTSEWEGWGTALKPALEPITVARKPLSEKSVAENVLKWGTGGINIDESRVEIPENDKENYEFNNNGLSRMSRPEGDKLGQFDGGWKIDKTKRETPQGRFPANIIHDNSEEVRECFPEQKSGARSSKHKIGNEDGEMFNHGIYGKYKAKNYDDAPAESGNASRFFKSIIYQAKASKSERNKGLEDFPDQLTDDGRQKSIDNAFQRGETPRKNNHPTVKPIALMEYLVKLVSKEGATVLDPFTGSGSTLIACKNLKRNYIGIEKEPEYITIAQARLSAVVIEPTLF